MIAPAMNTGPQERLSYRDLARQQAQVERSISLKDFSRLSAISGVDTDAQSEISVSLEFYQNTEDEPCVRGSASVALELLCHRCAESVVFPLQAHWDVVFVDEVSTDAQTIATKAEHKDVVSVEGPAVSVVEIAEDELLLALPERLCRSEPCELMPELAYPAQGARAGKPEVTADTGASSDSGSQPGTRKAFAGLADMIADKDSEQNTQPGSGQSDDDAS